MNEREMFDLQDVDVSQQLVGLKSALMDRLNELESDKKKQTEQTMLSLVDDLERIKSEWENCLYVLKQHEAEYKSLISELKEIKVTMNTMGLRIPLHKKFSKKFKQTK